MFANVSALHHLGTCQVCLSCAAADTASAFGGVEVKLTLWAQDNMASSMMAPAVFAMLLLAVAIFQLMCKLCGQRLQLGPKRLPCTAHKQSNMCTSFAFSTSIWACMSDHACQTLLHAVFTCLMDTCAG